MEKVFKVDEELNKYKIFPSIISCHTIKPLDVDGIKNMLKKHKKVIIVEENVSSGSLSSKIKEISKDYNINSKIISFNLQDKFLKCYSSYDELLDMHGISVKKILQKII